MKGPVLFCAIMVCLGFTFVVGCDGNEDGNEPLYNRSDEADTLFDPSIVHDVQIVLPEKAWRTLLKNATKERHRSDLGL
jgi:hypothetical protein